MGKHGEDKEERKPTPLRTANGIVAALLCVIFAAHAILGGVKIADPTFTGRFVWVVWVGVGLVAVHIIMSIGTTVSMWTDTVRPPSDKKKRHQIMKWVTGVALLAVAGIHMASGMPGSAWPMAALMLCVAAALGWHMFVASKSLLKDLHVPHHKKYRPYLQAALIAACVVAGVIILAAAL